MSVVIQGRTYGYDNISAGNAYGQETNQAQFFPYTPGNVDPLGGFEHVQDPSSSVRYNPNTERAVAGGTMAYGTEIP